MQSLSGLFSSPQTETGNSIMENYLAFIMIVAICFAVIDLITARQRVMQRQIYYICLVVLYVLFVIRYYYGPDIYTYVPHYEKIPSPSNLAFGNMRFEAGYEYFCSVLHWAGLSYWGMTAVITTLYFASLACLLSNLKSHQPFALSCIILFDYNLICAENRQCLAVALFIFTILLLLKKKYILSLVFAMAVVITHKSGFIPVALTLMGVLLYGCRQNDTLYNVLIVVLMGLMLVPVAKVAGPILSHLPLPASYVSSLRHHLLLGRQLQVVALIYLSVLALISIHTTPHSRQNYTWLAIETLIGMMLIVAFYQYFFLINRVRSYFLPFIVCYVIGLTCDSESVSEVPYSAVMRQAVAVLLILYFSHSTIGYINGAKRLHAPVAKSSTILQLRRYPADDIRDRQMKIALRYWREDYMKENNNKL